MIRTRYSFPNREALAIALAGRTGRALSRAISRHGNAVLAVSGGTTPALFLGYLSRQPITWEKVVVTLVDERQVPEDHPRSNAALVRRNLLVNAAAKATFVPLFRNERKAAGLLPHCVVLGMGEDGHTASFFPGGDRLAAALDLQSTEALTGMVAPGAGEPRLTFTLARLLEATDIFLHVEGVRKAAVLETALAGKDAAQMPVRAVLHAPQPVDLYWCP